MSTEHSQKLTSTAQFFLNKSIEDRIKKCKEQVWIPYTQAQLIMDELEELFDYPKKDRMPNLLIVGDTNNGKSTILKQFIDKHPMYLEGCTIIPIIKITAPIAPSHNALYEKILDELLVPYGISESASRKEYQVKKILQDIQTKMIIIDEFQDIFHGDVRQQRKFLAGIKHLGNDLQIPIVAAGVWEVQSVMSADPQMANRFETLKLKKWNPDIEFARLLASFESTLPLKEPSNLHSKELFKMLFDMSEGYIGELATLLQKASVFALKKNKEKIDVDILKSINFIKPSLRRR
jgi:hypothetical protein